MIFTNIYSKGNYPSNMLSNFAHHSFVFDGIRAVSMESLLQSFKFRDTERQKEICGLCAKDAKRTGSMQLWNDTLFWKGVPYKRKGADYQKLLTRAYTEMLKQSPAFRQALLDSSPILLHTVGKHQRSKTCLTDWEFCLILTQLRKKLKKERNISYEHK